MTSLSEMQETDRKDLVQKLAVVVKNHEFEKDVTVNKLRMIVCPLKDQTVQDNHQLNVNKNFPNMDMKEKVDAFKEDALKVVEGIKDAKIGVQCQLGAGSQYQPIENVTNFYGDEVSSLNITEGAINVIYGWNFGTEVYNDQTSKIQMQKFQDKLTEKEEEWGQKVKVTGVQLDGRHKEAQKFMAENKDWSKINLYQAYTSKVQWDVREKYPDLQIAQLIMMVDATGKVQLCCQKQERPDNDILDDLEALIKGEELKGPGTLNYLETENYKDTFDAAVCQEYLDKFAKEIAPGLQQNEKIKAAVAQMSRAFVVMMYEENLNVETGQLLIIWKNFRDLDGSQENIDICKEEIAKVMDDSMGYNLNIRANVE